MSDNAREARGKGDWSRVGKAKRLSVFEHLAKFDSESAAKTDSPLGQALPMLTHNSLAMNRLRILVRALARDLRFFAAKSSADR
jgi:hypothetical protein